MLSPSGGCRRRISQEGGGSGMGGSGDLRAFWNDRILNCLESRKSSMETDASCGLISKERENH